MTARLSAARRLFPRFAPAPPAAASPRNPSPPMFTFATDYCIGVFISTLGALQFAFSVGGLRALLIFKRALIARALGLALAAGGFAFFFLTEFRNINDYEGGLDAPSQALFFFLGAAAALAFTLALTSVLNRRMVAPEGEDAPEGGIDSLRNTNYAASLSRGVSHWRGNWRTWTKRYFSP